MTNCDNAGGASLSSYRRAEHAAHDQALRGYVITLDILPLIISVVALTVSALGYGDSRRRDKRDTFLKVHENLTGDDKLHGRQLLFEKVSDTASVEALSRDEYRLINRALSAYESLGLYVRRGYVKERDVMEIWAVPVYRSWVRGAAFFEHRQGYQGAPLWSNYRYVAERSESYLKQHGIEIDPAALESPDNSPNLWSSEGA